MTDTYLIALIVVLALTLVKGLAAPVRFYEYPYFMATAFIVFIVPQALSLYWFPGKSSPQSVEAVFLMTLLCVVACIAGYRVPANRWIVKAAQAPLSDQRLFHFGMLFILSGILFGVLIAQMTDAERGGSMWTGRVTIYFFFASLTYPGFSICFREALLRGRQGAWFWSALGAWTPIISGIFHGRREAFVLFLATVVLTLFYQKRFVVPRYVALAAIVAATLAIPATTKYRTAVHKEGVSAAFQVDFVGNFQNFLSRPALLELRNAAMIIDATKKVGRYGLGRAYWDQIVFRFVPAQIFGKDFKRSIMFLLNDSWLQREFAIRGYEVLPGTTSTGMADSFREFGYFGAAFFAVLAVVFKSLWASSLNRDAVFAQLLYMQTSTSAMRAITHQTADFLPGLLYNLIFIGLAAWYARQREPQRATPRLARAVR